ncbi:MAG: hypothetical protein GWO24_15710, partial [Akkermansiaceae bacterium]|nr:hypothetical protein [Akkermansiaceae bacterium]
LAGNELHARYLMAKGVIATFDSIANDQTANAGFGLQLVGSKGIVNIQADRDPVAHLVPGNPFKPTKEPRPWVPITTSGVGEPEGNPALIKDVHEHVVAIRDLIEACDEDRAPACDAKAGAMTVEMICAVFASHVEGSRAVGIPLKERDNPLLRLHRDPKAGGPAAQAKPREVLPVPGRPGFFFNPWTKVPVDLRGIPSGTLVRDPMDPDLNHKFRVP